MVLGLGPQAVLPSRRLTAGLQSPESPPARRAVARGRYFGPIRHQQGQLSARLFVKASRRLSNQLPQIDTNVFRNGDRIGSGRIPRAPNADRISWRLLPSFNRSSAFSRTDRATEKLSRARRT